MSRDCSSTRLKFVICHICYDKLNSVFNYLRPMETVRRQSIKAAHLVHYTEIKPHKRCVLYYFQKILSTLTSILTAALFLL